MPGSDFAMALRGHDLALSLDRPGMPRARRRIDGFNDVGWARLSNGTLGVTWSIIGGTDEADMALSTRVPWHTGCTTVGEQL